MPRPPKRKVAVLAEAQEIGKLKAQRRARKWKVPLDEKLLGYFEKLLDQVDPIEAGAVIATTIVVHEVIFNLEAFAKTVRDVAQNTSVELHQRLEPFLNAFHIPHLDPNQTSLPEVDITGKSSILTWLAAFGIAYFTIKHGDDLLAVAGSFIGKSISGASATV